MSRPLWNTANLLTLSRLPFSALLFWAIHFDYWWLALGTFIVASLTDALDGWVARKYNQGSAFGRAFDPLIDKVMILGAFIFLMDKPVANMQAWMVAAMMAREFLITGLRGYIEALGVKFGADWFGKSKTILQIVFLSFVFLAFALNMMESPTLRIVRDVLLYGTIIATLGSGVQYVWRAWPHLKTI